MSYKQWRSAGLKDGDGVIVASSKALMNLLPWWWLNYRLHNSFPVTFLTFDLPEEVLAWCRQRGEVVALNIPDDFVMGQEHIDPEAAKVWEKWSGEGIWAYRKVWMKKPLAMIQSPYERTIWTDIDCQVRKSLQPLFETCENPSGFSIASEPEVLRERHVAAGLAYPDETVYNTGVLVFKRKAPLMQKWIEKTLRENSQFYGDQEILSRIIYDERPEFTEISRLYNWIGGFLKRHSKEMNRQAVILHWTGRTKLYIIQQMNMLKQMQFDIRRI